MELPHIPHTIVDPRAKVRYIVLAYREISQAEAVQQIKLYLAQKKKAPKAGSEVKILTVIGATDRL